jgi:chloramphenicol 3-O phosphotransferase
LTEGQIIILNGTSSAGKTTLSKTIQRVLDGGYVHLGIDEFADAMAPGYRGTEPPADQGLLIVPAGSGDAPRADIGPVFERLILGMHRAWAEMAKAGNNLVADHWLWYPGWLEDCVEVLAGLSVLFVGVRCPLIVAEQREAARGNRFLGSVRAVYEEVHKPGIYDLEVDTSILDPMACALTIKKRLEDGSPPQAFDQLRTLFRAQQASGLGSPATTKMEG